MNQVNGGIGAPNSLIRNADRNRGLLQNTHVLTHDMSKEPGIVNWAYANQGWFVRELGIDNPSLTNLPKYEEGMPKFITWFRDVIRNYPKVYNDIIYMYTTELFGRDRITNLFPPTRVGLGLLNVEFSRFEIEHGPSEPSVENTPARIISAKTESGSISLSYYAQMQPFDYYAMSLPGGLQRFEQGWTQVLSNRNAALKYHILRVPIENTPCFYFNPNYLNSGMTMPLTAEDCILNMENHFNAFGKEDKTPELILAEAGLIFSRADRVISKVIVPISKYDAFIHNGRMQRYFYDVSGPAATQNREAMTNTLPADASLGDSIGGIELLSIPLLEVSATRSRTSRILTAEICTGGHAVFLKDFHGLDAKNYLSSWEEIATCSWKTNQYDWYPYADTVQRDLHWNPTVRNGGVPEFGDGVSGRLNRVAIHNFLGRSNDSDEQITNLKKRYAFINTKFPTSNKMRHKMDPVMIYNPERKIWHPWGAIGEASNWLSDDEFLLLSYKTLALRLQEGGAAFGSPDYKNNALRCLGERHVLAPGFDVPPKLDALGTTGSYDESDFQNDIGANTSKNHTEAHFEVYPPSKNQDLVRRWTWIDENIFDQFENAAAKLFLLAEPSQETFYLFKVNNVANPFSAIIADFSEKSDVSTPVFLAEGQLGESYLHDMAPLTTGGAENKEGGVEVGSFVGARIKDDRDFLPYLFGLGGCVQSGSTNGFLIDNLPSVNNYGEKYPPFLSAEHEGLEKWRRNYLNQPDNAPDHSKLVFFQGANAGSANCGRGDLPYLISLMFFFREPEFVPYMSRSADFNERQEQMIPGAAFQAWMLQPHRFFTTRAMSEFVPTEKYSYAEIVATRRSNTLAPRIDTVRYTANGKFEATKGIHIRGERVPGLVHTDQGQHKTQ